jgi:hypothetical protein
MDVRGGALILLDETFQLRHRELRDLPDAPPGESCPPQKDEPLQVFRLVDPAPGWRSLRLDGPVTLLPGTDYVRAQSRATRRHSNGMPFSHRRKYLMFDNSLSIEIQEGIILDINLA